MTIVFASLAQREFDDAVQWYEAQLPGLGSRFQAENQNGLARIEAHPQA